jgi:ornithine carbamoyltransferase
VAPTHLLRVLDLEANALEDILELAAAMKIDGRRWFRALEPGVLVGVFSAPSTRTRVAFADAAHRLGLFPLFVDSTTLQLARGEELGDTARSLSTVARLIVTRMHSHVTLEEFARHSSVPVINALSEQHHPCEAIATLFTLREHYGGLVGRSLAFVGDGNNFAHSLMEASALAGVRLSIASPPGYGPDRSVSARATAVAKQTGGAVIIEEEPHIAVRGADAVLSDAWVSIGDEDEVIERQRAFARYRVDEALMASAGKRAVFIHCLPARRGEEVTAEVIDGPRSLVWQQAANHVYVAQAVMWALTRGVRKDDASPLSG